MVVLDNDSKIWFSRFSHQEPPPPPPITVTTTVTTTITTATTAFIIMPVVSDIMEEAARGFAVETSAVISPTLYNALAGVEQYGSDSSDDAESPSEDEDNAGPVLRSRTAPSTQHFRQSDITLYCQKQVHQQVLASVAMAAEIAKAAGLNTSTKTAEPTSMSPPLGTMPKLAPIETARKTPKPRSAITKPRIAKASSLASAIKRVDEFGEPLCVKNNTLWCGVCNSPLCSKKSTVANHIASKKHLAAKKANEDRKKKKTRVQQSIHDYDKANPGLEKTTVPMEIRKQRYEVVELFLRTGLPLVKVDAFRPFFEGLGLHLTHSSHLRLIVPQVLMAEKKLIFEEVEKEYVSFTFDGTTRVGECINGILRFCTADFNLVQRLSLFVTLEKSTNGDELKGFCINHRYHLEDNPETDDIAFLEPRQCGP